MPDSTPVEPALLFVAPLLELVLLEPVSLEPVLLLDVLLEAVGALLVVTLPSALAEPAKPNPRAPAAASAPAATAAVTPAVRLRILRRASIAVRPSGRFPLGLTPAGPLPLLVSRVSRPGLCVCFVQPVQERWTHSLLYFRNAEKRFRNVWPNQGRVR